MILMINKLNIYLLDNENNWNDRRDKLAIDHRLLSYY